MRIRRALAIFVLIALSPPALAGGGGGSDGGPRFADALAAYDGGRYGEARDIWRELAAAGDVRAMTGLAGLYRQGVGVRTDAKRAATLYRRAARQGDAVAQMNFGEMLAAGEGVARDAPLAWAWLRLAAEGGRIWARDRAARMWAAFDAQTRARAGARLKDLHAKETQPR